MSVFPQFQSRVVLLSSLLLSACAATGTGSYAPSHDMVQKALDSVGELLGGGKGGAKGSPPSAQSGTMVVINSQNIMIEGTHPTDARWQGKLLAQTSLYHLFTDHPRNTIGEYWPRVAIRIDDYSESLVPENGINSQYMTQMEGSAQPNVARPVECLKLTAVIWTTPKKSEKIEHIVHCNADLKMSEKNLSVGAMNNYASLMAPVSISSLQVRSFGPKSPSKLLPEDTRTDSTLYSTGQYLFSSLFMQMGYRGPLDGDPRVWFVSLSKDSL